jgi:hypothetical protein
MAILNCFLYVYQRVNHTEEETYPIQGWFRAPADGDSVRDLWDTPFCCRGSFTQFLSILMNIYIVHTHHTKKNL